MMQALREMTAATSPRAVSEDELALLAGAVEVQHGVIHHWRRVHVPACAGAMRNRPSCAAAGIKAR